MLRPLLAILALAVPALGGPAVAHEGHHDDGAFVIESRGERCYVRAEGLWIDTYRETNGDGPGSHDDTGARTTPEGPWVAWWAERRLREESGGAILLPLTLVWTSDTGLQAEKGGDQRYVDTLAWARDCNLLP